MIKYMTTDYRKGISPIEVTRETECFIIVAVTDWYTNEPSKDHKGNLRTRRVAKESSFEKYFDTWEEAFKYISGKATRRVDSLRHALIEARRNLAEISRMEPPTTEVSAQGKEG